VPFSCVVTVHWGQWSLAEEKYCVPSMATSRNDRQDFGFLFRRPLVSADLRRTEQNHLARHFDLKIVAFNQVRHLPDFTRQRDLHGPTNRDKRHGLSSRMRSFKVYHGSLFRMCAPTQI
jgi:hypothetical protein